VAVVGAQLDEIHVDADPEKMRALDLTPEDLRSAIEQANANGTSGTIRRGQFRFSVRAGTEFQSPDQISMVPVGRPGSGIKLRDIATISIGLQAPKTLTRLDGGAAVGLIVYKDAGSNTVNVTRELVKSVEQLRTEFPSIKLSIVATQADFVT